MNFKGMKHGSVIAWIASLALLMSLTACDGSGENTGGESTGNGALEPVVLGPGAGRLKIVAASGTVAESESMAVVEMSFAAESELDSGEALLKNPTSPVVSAVIEILAVDIHGADGKWYRFGIEPYLLDLMNLDAQFAEVLGRATAPEGTYDKIRFLTAATGAVTYEDGRTDELRVPSGPQSGIKVHLTTPITVANDRLTITGITFDVSKSFVFPGSGGVIFKPVLKVAGQTIVDLPEGGGDTGGEGEDTGSGDGGDTGSGGGGPGTGGTIGDGSGGSGGTETGNVELPTDPEDGDGNNFPPVFGV